MEVKSHRFINFLLGRQGTRNAVLINVALSSMSKVLGYVRTLLVAYLFGASAFVDAYYVAFGSISFMTGMLETSLESAIMPKLVQNDEAVAASLFAATAKVVVIIIAMMSLLIFLFSQQFVLIFARTFDPVRVAYATHMVKWILPWGAASIIMSLFSLWANYQNRFSASALVYALSNVFIILALLLLRPVLHEMALPASQSVGFVILAFLMWGAVGSVPVRRRQQVTPELKRAVTSGALFSMVWSGAIFIYSIVDRYFASSLPVGNVAAISYAQLIFQHPLGIAGAAFTIYFVRASTAVQSEQESESLFFITLYMAWSYFFPVAILLFILANPLVKLLLGYGAFDASAVALTVPCLAIIALGLPILMCNMIVGKYALAGGKLRALVFWSYVGVVGNATLDWFLVRPFGAPGLCAATTIMWHVSTLSLMAISAPRVLKKLAVALCPQVAFAAAWAMPLYFITRRGVLFPLIVGVAAGVAHILLCERFGAFDKIPAQWRISSILKILVGEKF